MARFGIASTGGHRQCFGSRKLRVARPSMRAYTGIIYEVPSSIRTALKLDHRKILARQMRRCSAKKTGAKIIGIFATIYQERDARLHAYHLARGLQRSGIFGIPTCIIDREMFSSQAQNDLPRIRWMLNRVVVYHAERVPRIRSGSSAEYAHPRKIEAAIRHRKKESQCLSRSWTACVARR